MKLLLATYNYPPEAYGGSEVYIEALGAELVRAGHSVEILCGSREQAEGPEPIEIEEGTQGGLKVWRIRLAGGNITMQELYTTRVPGMRDFWKSWLALHRPDVLHLHGRTLAISLSMMEAAADLNIPMVATLHNVPMLCPRNDYITWKGSVCDGRVELLKCVHCTTATRAGSLAGITMAALTPLLARLPVPESGGWSRSKSALHYPGLLRMQLKSQQEMLGIVRRWHVFSRWSRQALELNGVPHEKIVLVRHPLILSHESFPTRVPRGAALRIGFFGRFDKVKGLPVLLEAMRRAPDAALHLEIFGGAQDNSETSIVAQMQAATAHDPRIVWRGRIPHGAQPAALAGLDVVVVPSLWVETGPLTVLEAFSAGLPVVGSDLSGINEWVAEGKNGWLFPPGDSTALAAILERLTRDRSLIEAAQDFPELDSAKQHTAKIMEIYSSLFPRGAGKA
jgi:glycosyltransferase involved in cell wall biosynthesis